MDFFIRKASMQDYENLCLVLAECDALHSARLPGRFHPYTDPQLARTREFILGMLTDPDTSIFVAEQAGQITGAIITILHDTPPIPILTPRRYASIDIISVREAQWGRGIGQSLMAQAEEWARSRGAQEVELSVYSFNQRAIRFYEDLGYEEFSKKMGKRL